MKTGLYETLERIAATIESRKTGDAATSYVARLLAEGEDAVLKNRRRSDRDRARGQGRRPPALVRETADLWFHSMILLARHGLGPGDVLAELHRREGIPERTRRRREKRNERRCARHSRLHFLQDRARRDPVAEAARG
jgi:phosphoribosyl-ATP pyrophosphohydrolase